MGFSAGGGGIVSPVTLDPIEFAGAATFDKDVTIANPRGIFLGTSGYLGSNGNIQATGGLFVGTGAYGGAPTVFSANNTGNVAITNTAAASKVLVIKGAVAQSVALIEAQDSAGGIRFSVDSGGSGLFEANNASRVGIGAYGPGFVAGLLLGGDTSLYRGGVNILATDSTLNVGGALTSVGATTLGGGVRLRTVGVTLVDAGYGVNGELKLATTAAQKVGFYGAAPIVQPATFAAVVGTAATNVAPFGFVTAAQADDLVTNVNTMRTVLRNLGLVA